MTNRRRFLSALLALLSSPVAVRTRSFAAEGLDSDSESPALVAPFRDAEGFGAAVLNSRGRVLFSGRLDGRGHGAAVSPDGKTAVVFARRPGRFAAALNLRARKGAAVFAPPAGRHFYGHGFFSADGRLLFATENDYESGRGVLGAYDAGADFRRVGEAQTGGVGPHEAILLRDGQTAAVANGGILTHPDYPRRKLNLSAMSPSLTLVDLRNGDLLERAALPKTLRRLSIRHLAEAADGAVWFGGQYEGPAEDAVELVGAFRRGVGIRTLPAREKLYAAMRQYVGAMAADASGERILSTSPRGGHALLWSARDGKVLEARIIPGAGGAARLGGGFVACGADGTLWRNGANFARAPGAEWDNHIAAV